MQVQFKVLSALQVLRMKIFAGAQRLTGSCLKSRHLRPSDSPIVRLPQCPVFQQWSMPDASEGINGTGQLLNDLVCHPIPASGTQWLRTPRAWGRIPANSHSWTYSPWTHLILFLNQVTVLAFTTSPGNEFHRLTMCCVKKYFPYVFNLLLISLGDPWFLCYVKG